MNNKIIVAFLILVVMAVSISSVSAFWPFDGGNEITVNDVKFNIPDGFEENVNAHDKDSKKESVEYVNDKHEKLSIMVVDNNNPNIHKAKDVDWGAHEAAIFEESIGGKDGIVSYEYTPTVWYAYIDNGKLVMITCPFVFDDSTKYSDFLGKVIK